MEILKFMNTPIKDSRAFLAKDDFRRLLQELENKLNDSNIDNQIALVGNDTLSKFLNKNKNIDNKTVAEVSSLGAINVDPFLFLIKNSDIIGTDKIIVSTLNRDEVSTFLDENKKLIERMFANDVISEFTRGYIKSIKEEMKLSDLGLEELGLKENSYDSFVFGRLLCFLSVIDYINSIIGISDSIDSIFAKIEWFEVEAEKSKFENNDYDKLIKSLKSIKNAIESKTKLWNSLLTIEMIQIEKNYMANNKHKRSIADFVKLYVNKSYELLVDICYYYSNCPHLGNNGISNAFSKENDKQFIQKIKTQN